MMEISNNQLFNIVKGDTLEFPIIINVQNRLTPRKYVLKTGDKLYFAIMQANVPFEDAQIKKEYTNANLDEHDCVVVSLTSAETSSLCAGTYYYEVKLQNANGVQTVIDRRKFSVIN